MRYIPTYIYYVSILYILLLGGVEVEPVDIHLFFLKGGGEFSLLNVTLNPS